MEITIIRKRRPIITMEMIEDTLDQVQELLNDEEILREALIRRCLLEGKND